MRKSNVVPWMLLASLILTASARAAADSAVAIRKKPTTLAVRTFDPKNKPRDMPALRKDEAAVAESSFACAVQIEVESTIGPDDVIKTKVVAVRADLRLDVTVWVPKNASKKIRDHEEGHRYISEFFYQDAEKLAARVAENYIGKQLKVSSKDDVQPAIKKAATEFCGEYLGAVGKPSQAAQEKYDEITDHGRNKVPEKRAIQQALEGAKKPDGKPANAAEPKPAR